MCNAEVNFHPITMKLVSLESLDYVECSGIVSYSIDTIYNVRYVIKFVTERHVVKINTVSRARFSKLFVLVVVVVVSLFPTEVHIHFTKYKHLKIQKCTLLVVAREARGSSSWLPKA